MFFQNFHLSNIDFFTKKYYTVIAMKKYEYVQDFFVKYCDVDFKDELKVSTTLAYFEEVACASADELGFGYSFVKPRGYAFIVSNLYCEFVKPIALGKTVRLKTWPTPPSHVVFGREYQIFLENGELCTNASSRWCLIDLQSAKLLKSSVVENQDYSTYNTTKLFDGLRWKIPTFAPEEGELKFSLTIANSEYDHNMHVNNTRYADYCMNCFSIDELSKMQLKRFMITYIKQVKENETLRFYRKKQDDGSCLVHGFYDRGELVTQAQLWFEK